MSCARSTTTISSEIAISSTADSVVAMAVIRKRIVRRHRAQRSSATRRYPAPRTVSIDVPTEGLVDRGAEPADVDLDDVGVALEVVLPDAVEDLTFGHDLADAADEELEHVELAGRERDLVVGPPRSSRRRVDPQDRRRSRAPERATRPAPRRSTDRTLATSTGNENGLVR